MRTPRPDACNHSYTQLTNICRPVGLRDPVSPQWSSSPLPHIFGTNFLFSPKMVPQTSDGPSDIPIPAWCERLHRSLIGICHLCPTLAQLKKLQRFVGELMENIFQVRGGKGRLSMELPSFSTYLLISKDRIRSKLFMLYIAELPQDLFTNNALIMVANLQNQFGRCPECEGIFLSQRKDQQFCSSRCQNTAAVRRLRQSASALKSKRGKIPKSSKNPKVKTLEKKGD